MMRRLLNFVCALSLLLSFAVLAVWVRSNWTKDSLEYGTVSPSKFRYRSYDFQSSRGSFTVLCYTATVERSEVLDMVVDDITMYTGRRLGFSYAHGRATYRTHRGWPSVWNDLGFDTDSDHSTGPLNRFRRNPRAVEPLGTLTKDLVSVTFPHWLPWLIFLLGGWPLIRRWARLATARMATPPNHCRQCGYDLRATPDRCPECGHVPEAAATTGVAAR